MKKLIALAMVVVMLFTVLEFWQKKDKWRLCMPRWAKRWKTVLKTV